jgi:hypothetical protein
VSQQGTKPAGRDWGFSTEGFPLINISVQLLALVVTQGRVLFVIFIFSVNVVVLLLLLLSKCALSFLATLYHQLNVQRLPPPKMYVVVSQVEALAVVVRSEVPTDLWADDRCSGGR